MKFFLFLKKIIRKSWGGKPTLTELRLSGVTIGENCHVYGSIDQGHAYLASMGNNVTLASGCRILTHDGSTKKIIVRWAGLISAMMFSSVPEVL